MKDTTYFGIKNLSSSSAFPVTRPDQKATLNPLPSAITTKAERRVWSNRPDTDHLFISGYEAANPALRVNPRQGNPVFKMHALIADYDAYAPGHGTVKELLARHFASSPQLVPSWVAASRSDGRRLVWEFAEPVGSDAPKFLEEFVKVLRRDLKLPALLAGLDEAALANTATYYEIGEAWERINPYPLPSNFLADSFGEAVEKSSRKHTNTGGIPEIPMEEIHKEIERKFPGALGIPADQFTPGARGPKFWAGGGNPTACVFYPHGVYCYSTDKIFHSYGELLGDDFVRAFEKDRLGSAVGGLYYFGRGQFCRVWEEGAERKFARYNKDEVKDYLKVTWGVNPKRSNEAGGSEVDRAVQIVHEARMVSGMAPFLWNPNLLVESGGERYLNNSTVRVLEPVEGPAGPVRWGDGFPWTARWLYGMFSPRTQLLRLLAWMRRSYKNAREFTPGRNLALFLVGTTNLGKTLWNQIWWPHIMGGGAEAASFLIGGGGFNKTLATAPHWFVDDARASATERDMQTFTETLKAFIANPTIEYHPKFVDPVPIEYSGTACITMNEDDMSLQMLPSLDRSVIDKVLILLCAKPQERTVFEEFKETHGNDAVFSETLKREAPAFLRWLLQWVPPESVTGGSGSRFGIAPFVHPDLSHASVVNSSAGDLQAVIDVLMDTDAEMQDAVKKDGYYDCTAIRLLNHITTNPLTVRLLGSFGNSARGVGTRLAKLNRLNSTRVANLRSAGKQSKSKGEATVYRLFPPSVLN